MECGKSVSTEVPEGTIVRAWVECPECIEKNAKKGKRYSGRTPDGGFAQVRD
jgi:hypothetical protein